MEFSIVKCLLKIWPMQTFISVAVMTPGVERIEKKGSISLNLRLLGGMWQYGQVTARHNLGCVDGRAMKLFILAAKELGTKALRIVKKRVYKKACYKSRTWTSFTCLSKKVGWDEEWRKRDEVAVIIHNRVLSLLGVYIRRNSRGVFCDITSGLLGENELGRRKEEEKKADE